MLDIHKLIKLVKQLKISKFGKGNEANSHYAMEEEATVETPTRLPLE